MQIQLVDAQNRPMFDVGSAVVGLYARHPARDRRVLVDVENRISLAGHTDAVPTAPATGSYSNWELSAIGPMRRGANW
ncbi:MAG: hypothetical protein R3E42_06840 [Burkholderiaceae bacterium]